MKSPAWFAALLGVVGIGCASTPTIAPVENVELERFMGDWYVIAHIPSRWEKTAFNAIESYRLQPNGRIETTFRYRDGGFDKRVKTMNPVGRVVPGTNNAVWGMQFIWPIQAEYVIGVVDPAYTQTVIVRSKRDYAWIMARTPAISDADYQRHVDYLKEQGYDLSQLRRVPQQWPEANGSAR